MSKLLLRRQLTDLALQGEVSSRTHLPVSTYLLDFTVDHAGALRFVDT